MFVNFSFTNTSFKPVSQQVLFGAKLDVPSISKDSEWRVRMAVPLDYQEKIKVALDCLPWKSLSWSIHRGMREILLAFGKPIMNKFRANLAALLHRFVASKPVALTRIGWDLKFVQKSMGEVAFSAMLEGSGDSCDLVREIGRAHV